MKNWFYGILIQFVVVTSLFGQQVENNLGKKHSIYAEVFGQGFSGSLNYDMLFNRDRKWKKSFTVGIVFTPKAFDFGDGTYFGIPVSYNWLYGKKRNFLELGVGLTTQACKNVSEVNPFSIYTYLTPKIGYRFQAFNNGIFFRATITPHIALLNSDFRNWGGKTSSGSYVFNNVLNLDYPVFPWVGFSLGYTFK